MAAITPKDVSDGKIQSGTLIRCINNDERHDVLTIGKIYTVDKVNRETIEVIADTKDIIGFWFNRFELAETQEKDPESVKELRVNKIEIRNTEDAEPYRKVIINITDRIEKLCESNKETAMFGAELKDRVSAAMFMMACMEVMKIIAEEMEPIKVNK